MAELIVASAVIGIVVVPTVLFVSNILKGMVKAAPRAEGTDNVRRALTVIERDFNDMNEIVRGNNLDLRFYMDSHRLPTYKPTDDWDGDGVPNDRDPDIDNDALFFDGVGNARSADYLQTVSTVGWRSGFNLEDDDDDNDGQRDVQCRYVYDAAKGELHRFFKYNGSALWTNDTLILDHLTSFDFAYFGSLDYIEGAPVGAIDQDNNRIITEDEIEDMDGTPGSGGGALTSFNERRYIMGVRLTLKVVVNPKEPTPTLLSTEFWPPLMAIKRKYP